MKLGAFSISLTVKDLRASKEFYQKLGFTVFHGNESQNWLILKNGNTVIGLFQGMFEGNLLTFNPGWDQNAAPLADFDDVRTIQQQLQQQGIAVGELIDATTTGPAHFTVTDPDGNTLLFDQHV